MTERYDVALDLLDIQLIDVHRVGCGRIDDLELEGDVVTALLVGRGAWRGRLPRPLRRLAAVMSSGSPGATCWRCRRPSG